MCPGAGRRRARSFHLCSHRENRLKLHRERCIMPAGEHNHGASITVEQSILLNRLQRIGKIPPPHASLEVTLQWLEEHRHLVEDRPTGVKEG